MVAAVPSLVGAPRIMLDFGTGQQIPQTVSAAAQYSSAQQSLYGIWDWNLSHWNSVSTTQYASLGAPQTIGVSGLQIQTVLGTFNSTGTGTGNGLRTVSSNPVCWAGATECAGGNNKYGWYFPLTTSTGPASPEQVIFSPILELGTFIVNTTIPANNSPTTCSSSTARGWTMALDPATGGAFQNSFFGTSNNTFISISNQVVSGIALNAVGSPSIVTANNLPYLVNQTVTGVGAVNAINPPGGAQSKRLTWTQKR
jgi:type IV pilus assembly protein PilY1